MDPIGLIGFGGIAKTVISKLENEVGDALSIAGILVRDINEQKENLPFVTDIHQLIKNRPRVIAECASHGAVRDYGEEILRSGIDLIIISIGSLADLELYERLRSVAHKNGTKIILPAGAVGGIDALSSARLAGLRKVLYRSRKPASAWRSSAADQGNNLDHLTKPHIIYQGPAREAALRFPKNTNAVAAVALAGLGFDRTNVELIVDPTVNENIHEIEVEAESGDFTISLTGKPLATNPRTSMLTAHSVVRALLAYKMPVII